MRFRAHARDTDSGFALARAAHGLGLVAVSLWLDVMVRVGGIVVPRDQNIMSFEDDI
jgi:hypothetical protein